MIDPALARKIRMVGIDVDGTLTDGGLYIGAMKAAADTPALPVEFKRFDIQDGLGINLLRRAGLLVAVVTGRAGDAARIRAEELKVDAFLITGGHKLAPFEAHLFRRSISWNETCFVGDDLVDIPVMQRAGLAVAVANAVPEVKALAQHVTKARGGHGAVREFIEDFLRARGTWDSTVETYITERGAIAAG